MFWLLGILGGLGALGGAAALLGGGPAMLAIGERLLGFVKQVPLKVWLGLFAAIALVLLVRDRNHWKATATDRAAKLTIICQATRDAAARPRLGCGQVPVQIKLLGKAVGELKGAIGRQNVAVAALGAKTREQQARAVQATEAAQKRADKAQATSQRLTASAQRTPPPGKLCEPSDTLKGAWK